MTEARGILDTCHVSAVFSVDDYDTTGCELKEAMSLHLLTSTM